MKYPLLFCILLSLFYGCNLNAQVQGLGEVAANIYEPVAVVIHLVRAVSIICGGGLLLGSVLKYIEYRRNPVAVKLSTVFFMLVFGLALIVVGLLPAHLTSE